MTEHQASSTTPAEPLDAERARQVVTDAIRRIVPDADVAAAGDDTSLREEFELDSLDFLTFVERLTAATGVRIDESDYASLVTMGTSVAFLVARTAGA